MNNFEKFIRPIVKSDEEKPINKPIKLCETNFTPMPLDCLPKVLKQAILAIEARAMCPIEIAAQSVIATVALIAQAHVNVSNLSNGVSPVSLFLLTMAETGERKSTAYSIATNVIRQWEKEQIELAQKDFNDYENKLLAFEAAKRKIEANKKFNLEQMEQELKKLGNKPIRPPIPILIANDATIEGQWRLSKEGLGYGGIFTTEGGEILGGYSMRSENKLKTSAQLSKFWDGEAQSKVRMELGANTLYSRRLSIHLMVQPESAMAFFSDGALNNQGLLSRFLVAYPKSKKSTRIIEVSNSPEIDKKDVNIDNYYTKIAELLDICAPRPSTSIDVAELAPRILGYSKEAWTEIVSFHNRVELQLGNGGKYGDISGFAAKIAENALRLAAVFTFFENPMARQISIETMKNAVSLGEWYLYENLRISNQASQDVSDAEKLRLWLKSYPEDFISKRTMQQRCPSSIRKAERLMPAIIILLEAGIIEATDTSNLWQIIK